MAEDEQTDKTKQTGDDTDSKPEEPKPLSLFEKTEAIVTRQEEANKKTEELLKRQETLYANERLAGTAGGAVEKKVVEETPTEYAKRVMAGEQEIKEGGKYSAT